MRSPPSRAGPSPPPSSPPSWPPGSRPTCGRWWRRPRRPRRPARGRARRSGRSPTRRCQPRLDPAPRPRRCRPRGRRGCGRRRGPRCGRRWRLAARRRRRAARRRRAPHSRAGRPHAGRRGGVAPADRRGRRANEAAAERVSSPPSPHRHALSPARGAARAVPHPPRRHVVRHRLWRRRRGRPPQPQQRFRGPVPPHRLGLLPRFFPHVQPAHRGLLGQPGALLGRAAERAGGAQSRDEPRPAGAVLRLGGRRRDRVFR